MENNHKIAEFMGLTWVEKSLVAPHGSESEINYKVYNDGINNEIIHLKYDTSWDWLVPVMAKLSNLYDLLDDKNELSNEEFDKNMVYLQDISWYTMENKINECYCVIIEFIEFHNKRINK